MNEFSSVTRLESDLRARLSSVDVNATDLYSGNKQILIAANKGERASSCPYSISKKHLFGGKTMYIKFREMIKTCPERIT